MCICACMHVCIIAHVCRSKDSLGKSVLSFDYVDLRDQTQVVRLGSKCLYHWV